MGKKARGRDKFPCFLDVAKLEAVLAGKREPGLARDTRLEYRDAVELWILMEKLRIENGLTGAWGGRASVA